MHEIVDLRTVDTAIRVGGGVWFAASLLIGALLAITLRRGAADWLKVLFVASMGPAVLGLWTLYSWMTRYDPQTGYFGLDKVWVLVVNAVVFIVIGAAYGYLGGRLWRRNVVPPQEADASAAANDE